ncbi:MAG: DUF1801 domain-containing protein [Candidatus Kapaibacterium sp.]
MRIESNSPEEYISKVPDERKEAITKLRNTIKDNLPKGFKEVMSYGMIGYVVPHTLYPDGYHCSPELPLPFLSIASQKNFVALYHMGIYADKELLDWFVAEYPKYVKTKLDMGKSCIRFKKVETIPFDLIAELCTKMTAQQWIDLYEKNLKG